MATKRTLSVAFCFPSYGGNGGISSEVPDVRRWYSETLLAIARDERVGTVYERTVGDTPVTMVRNSFVLFARQVGADVLVMCDSDQNPMKQSHLPDFKPFWKSSFDYLYDHYDKGPVVIGAPYVGPPPVSNSYVFFWDSEVENGDYTNIKLEQYPRSMAAKMRGIQECAALPTGLIMYDMRAFSLIEPSDMSAEEILMRYKDGRVSKDEALRLLMTPSWFDYEWKDLTRSEKASTEDVMNTRNISLAGMAKLGYNPVLCNWDSPIGHWKPWCVDGRPSDYDVRQICNTFRNVVLENRRGDESVIDLKHTKAGGFWEQYAQKHGVNRVAPSSDSVDEYDDHKTPQCHLIGLADEIKRNADRVAPSNLHVVEIGSWKGDSAIAMASAAENVLVTCVDPFDGRGEVRMEALAASHDVYAEFRANVAKAGVESRIKVLRMPSLEAAEVCKGSKYDVVFIDGDHSYEGVKADIEAWFPLLMDDGVMIGHDYSVDRYPGLDRAVGEAFGHLARAYCWSLEWAGFWKVNKGEVLERRQTEADAAAWREHCRESAKNLP